MLKKIIFKFLLLFLFTIKTLPAFSNNAEKQRKEINGRLFAHHTYLAVKKNCFKNKEQNKEKAILRLAKELKFSPKSPEAIRAYEIALELLENSRVTINFEFSTLLGKYTDFNSMFIHNAYKVGDSKNPPGYMIGRDNSEKRVFNYETIMKEFPEAIVPFGLNPRRAPFHPYSRPVYGALDFNQGANGGAPLYGKSFIILKNPKDAEITFAHRDSFSGSVNINTLSTYGCFEPLIVNLDSRVELGGLRYSPFSAFVKCIKEKLSGRNCPSAHKNYGKDSDNYIEAQIFTEIQTLKDIEAFYLSKEETTTASFQSLAKKVLDLIDNGRKNRLWRLESIP